MQFVFLSLIVWLLGAQIAVALPAFPGAQGYGAEARGGRGGAVIRVTNLNDSGAGSLRACINASGPRTCVFRVGGTIHLNSELIVRNPFLTIAGQTAPGGGILLRGTTTGGGQMLTIRTHNVIVRYLRIRSGKIGQPARGQVNLSIEAGSENVIIDHVSTSWSLDENVLIYKNVSGGVSQDSVPDIRNITVQRSLIAEGLYPHSTGMSQGGEDEGGYTAWQDVTNTSMHHNLMAHNGQRNPLVMAPSIRIINNVVYDWGSECCGQDRNSTVDWIGNYFKPGSLSFADGLISWQSLGTAAPPSLLIEGNVSPPDYSESDEDNWEMTGMDEGSVTPLPLAYRRFTPLPTGPHPETVQTASAAYTSVLADVGANKRLACNGAWVANSDAVDTRILTNVAQGRPQRQGASVQISDPAQVGGYPQIAGGTACTDSDKDGMPNSWELARGLNPNNAADRNGDDDGDGYTNLEAFLNAIPFKR
jgi:pectate lyase